MTSVWKNKTFSEPTKPDVSPPNVEEDIYRDFNYKNIPNIYDASPPSPTPVLPANTSPIIENYEGDTSIMNKEDNPDSNTELSTSEIVLNDLTKEVPTIGEINKLYQNVRPFDPNSTETEIRRYVKDVNTMVNEIKSQNENLQGTNFNFDKMYGLIGTAISFPARVFDRTIDLFAFLYLNFVNNINGVRALDKKSKEYLALEEIAKRQMKNFMAVIISFWIVLNWWWLFNYVYKYLSFADLFDIPIIKIIMESLLMFLNIVNYALMGFKLDDYRLVLPKYLSIFLWAYRPITFVVFLGLVSGIIAVHKSNLDHQFRRAMSREPNTISGINTMAFFFSFLKMDVFNPIRMMERVAITQSFIITIFMLIFKLLFVLAFLPFGVMFVYLYLIIYSFFGIIMFNGINVFTAFRAMFMDLTNSVPDTNDPDEPPLMTLYRVVMNMFVYVGISITFIGILAENMKIVLRLNQKSATYNTMLVFSILALMGGILGSIINIWASLPKNYVEIAKKLAS